VFWIFFAGWGEDEGVGFVRVRVEVGRFWNGLRMVFAVLVGTINGDVFMAYNLDRFVSVLLLMLIASVRLTRLKVPLTSVV
jgi:hypothetical protein